MSNTTPIPLRESPLANAARPLLKLAQSITGMESTFVTSIDWDTQQQTVLFALNKGPLPLAEGLTVDWHDSMCRSLFLSGVSQSADIGVQVPSTPGSKALGIQTFFAVPILVNDVAIGTVCGASQNKMVLNQTQLEGMQLIADALRQLLEIEREKSHAHARADLAEQDAADARRTAERHAIDLLHMEQLAHTDVLTGLPNRRAFMARWEDELARSGRKHYPLALMLIDADQFKVVNDSAGHAMGDAVLRAIGATLLVVAKSPDIVARLGGDEFALATTHVDGAHLQGLAEKIQQLFGVMAAELGVRTTLSIGLVSSESCRRDRMFAEADKALYRSKHAGGNAIQNLAGELPAGARVQAGANCGHGTSSP